MQSSFNIHNNSFSNLNLKCMLLKLKDQSLMFRSLKFMKYVKFKEIKHKVRQNLRFKFSERNLCDSFVVVPVSFVRS